MPIDQIDRNEVLAKIRDIFGAGEPRDRDQAIRDLAAALGYDRIGPRIREILGNDLQTAVRRGILENERGQYSLLCRTIDEYTLDHLVAMLVAAMGPSWQTRDDAIVVAARYMGYRRTGVRIQNAFKSAINAAIRRGIIERDGAAKIRRIR
ncbi:MAG: hypothetical protein DCC68_07555 [Planctomycetota bacterium]|nr:MAG: hypothetical protein DCC68_07555 [Planctomycetota bacterium]